ncbi:MAG: NAD(P)/FAD-dependent oxidoreductase [Bacteroidota bacterium]|nr:NAD(P)/FAD-dependent oxidoreductase [Bacteroidota bacterium]
MDIYDVIIIGGGPAGLNAAVVLGRCMRKVLLFDHGQQRNRHSHGMHNYLTRDDISPAEFLKISQEELKKYGVHIKEVEVKHAKKNEKEIFVVKDCDENIYYSKKLILATGLTDRLPEVKGIDKFYGTSIYHCPYCDGWENKGKSIGVYSTTPDGIDVALLLKAWSKKITLYTDGKKYLTKKYRDLITKNEIEVVQKSISSFEGSGAQLKNIVFEDGEKSVCEALFFSNGYDVQCHLVESLGCNTGKNKIALTNKSQQTNIPGLYVAGDLSKDMHFVVVAAAEGAKAGVYVNKELTVEGQSR